MITTKKIFSGNYKVYFNNIFVGSIDKLENNEWVCLDIHDRSFEMCNSKKYALTLFYIGVNL
jgi:hypothetical protein